MEKGIFSPVSSSVLVVLLLLTVACQPRSQAPESGAEVPPRVEEPMSQAPKVEPEYFLDGSQTHSKFSRKIPPILTVLSGAVIQIDTREASDGQLQEGATTDDVMSLDFEPIHPLTGPIAVEGAQPGDVLAVTIHEIELGSYGWAAVSPGFGWLADEFTEPWIRTFSFAEGATTVAFTDGVEIPLEPFPGVIGVAPDTDEMLSTIPPRANGGNMDNQYMAVGSRVFLPVWVAGANLSIGDTHAAQGDGEVSGTAIEAPMRLVVEVELIQGGRSIPEPQYETDEYYAVTAFATTLDEAAKKATRYMVDYLEEVRGLERTEAYVLASLAGDLKISEVVDVPHVLVSMHIPKGIFTE